MNFGECNENSYLVNERQQLCFRKKEKQKRCSSSLAAPQYKKLEFHFLTFKIWEMLIDFSESVMDPFSELIMIMLELERLLEIMWRKPLNFAGNKSPLQSCFPFLV